MRTLFALSLLSLFSCGCACSTKLPDGLPVSYEYNSSGMRAYPIDWYRVETAEDGTVRILSAHDNGEILIVRGPEDIFRRIDELVRKYRLNKLKSRYKPLANIKDGKSWSVSINYPDDNGIYSRGYHSWPREELWKGVEAINQLLKDLSEAAAEEDILGHEDYHEYQTHH